MEDKIVLSNYAQLFIIIWVILSLMVGILAHKYKIGFPIGLILSLIFSPIVGFLIISNYSSIKNIFDKGEKK